MHQTGKDGPRSSVRRIASAVALAVVLVAIALPVSLSNAGAASGGTKTFTFTGGEQAFSVPDGVTSLDVTAVGGKGGVGVTTSSYNPPGGFGAVATGKLAVTPGQILFVEVGSNGGSPSVQSGGFNGGGQGGPGEIPGGGGGGGTDIRTISIAGVGKSLDSRLLIAGGGGGGGADGVPYPGGRGGQAGLPALNGDGSAGAGGTGNSSAGITGGNGGVGGTQVKPSSNFPTVGQFGHGGGGQAILGNYSGSGGAGGGGFIGGDGGNYGVGPGTNPPGGGGGGGGGGGSSHFATTATNTSVATDTSGTPQLTIAYKAGGNASGLKFGKVKLNKKKGTATLPVTVPGTGDLSVGGKGVVKKRPGLGKFSRFAKQITEAGTYKLKIKSKGKKKSKLFATGKVKVKAVVTFKPTSGDAVHDTKKIKLKKN
jgi:hypothetical protein